MEESSEEVVVPVRRTSVRRSSSRRSSAHRPRDRPTQPRATSTGCGLADLWRSIWYHSDTEHSDDEDEKEVIRDAFQIDLNKKQNRKDHHTKYYESSNLILRRGQEFSITVNLKDVPFDSDADRLILIFATGDHPHVKDETLIKVNICATKPPRQETSWQGYIGSRSKSDLTIQVTSSSQAIVGSHKFAVRLYTKDENQKKKRYIERCDEDIYLLFNPWDNNDQVYLADENDRIEYVLRDTGRMFVGSSKRIYPRPWKFGQYYKVCLEAALYLLDRAKLRKQGQGNVILVCRALTSQLNSKDNDGVLVGNWTGNYSGGESPTHWNGSVSIIHQYMKTKHPVKYGQCWVFSGLLTTVCRALGIPCRSITTFDAGIDKDVSMTVDYHVNEKLDPLHHLDDSAWNYHVWNEGWFKRPDLPAGYDGWQVIDSCPQDFMISEDLHRCGPAPLQAIKEGNVYLGYDTRFVFGEVNGDQITWIVKRNGETLPMRQFSKFKKIGKYISTKAVGSNDRHDITDLYKYPEGSEEERQAVERAIGFGSRRAKLLDFYDDKMSQDITFELEGKTNPSGEIGIKLFVKNESTEERSFDLKIRASATYYTGVTGEEVADYKGNVQLTPNQSKNIKWSLPAELYLNAIDEDASVRIWVTAKVKETDQIFFNAETFSVDKPDLTIETDKKTVRVGENVEITVKFENPLDIKLTNGLLQLEGVGSAKNVKIPIHRSIKQGQGLTERIRVTPQFPGKTEIIGSLNFRQLTGICGTAEIEITE